MLLRYRRPPRWRLPTKFQGNRPNRRQTRCREHSHRKIRPWKGLENRPNRGRTRRREHSHRKIRPWKGLELYLSLMRFPIVGPLGFELVCASPPRGAAAPPYASNEVIDNQDANDNLDHANEDKQELWVNPLPYLHTHTHTQHSLAYTRVDYHPEANLYLHGQPLSEWRKQLLKTTKENKNKGNEGQTKMISNDDWQQGAPEFGASFQALILSGFCSTFWQKLRHLVRGGPLYNFRMSGRVTFPACMACNCDCDNVAQKNSSEKELHV